MKFDRLTLVFISASTLFLFFVFCALILVGLLIFSPEISLFRKLDRPTGREAQLYFDRPLTEKQPSPVQTREPQGKRGKAGATVSEIAGSFEPSAKEKDSKSTLPSPATRNAALLPLTNTVKVLPSTNWKVKAMANTQFTGTIVEPLTLNTNIIAEPVVLLATNLVAEPIELPALIKPSKLEAGQRPADKVDGHCRSTLTLDNESGENALVKVVGPSYKVTTVPDGASRTVKVCSGHYYIKTRYGNNKEEYRYSRGDPFDVRETDTTYSRTTITLHPVVNGNYSTEPISADEFRKE